MLKGVNDTRIYFVSSVVSYRGIEVLNKRGIYCNRKSSLVFNSSVKEEWKKQNIKVRDEFFLL